MNPPFVPPLLQVRVAAKHFVAEDIVAFELVAADNGPLPDFEAGAHVDVHVPDGPVRQYSLYQLPDARHHYRIGVQRDPASRGGSLRLVDAVQPGDQLTISAPRNHFALHKSSGEALLFAGGIGITPILCMAEQLARQGQTYTLHYCAREEKRLAFVEQLRNDSLAGHVQIHLDDGPPQQKLDAKAAIGLPAPDRHLYICGPAGFMDHVLTTARELGWDEMHLHREYFSAAPSGNTCDSPFELELRRSGRVIPVAAGQTAASALLDAGVSIPLSCEQGVCGTCLTTVLAGNPDHRDMYLTEEERARNDVFLPCCSRAYTARLVIDL
ncbi:PDR/VanB family oxidoreductase [Burkholderia cepacia]|uniref:PDR/VanB family oxidoreductase n=1 Tax=Burkholderia cepacia TaxID=292 RepID=UPI000B05BFDC|nr:PDR/VanB family oxidoreductase [Burkholderia cepacia]